MEEIKEKIWNDIELSAEEKMEVIGFYRSLKDKNKEEYLEQQLQAYKDKIDKLREYLNKEENDGYCTTTTKKYWVNEIEQILNERNDNNE